MDRNISTVIETSQIYLPVFDTISTTTRWEFGAISAISSVLTILHKDAGVNLAGIEQQAATKLH